MTQNGPGTNASPWAPRVLSVVGLGLIGASIVLAARQRWPGLRIIGVDRPDVLALPAIAAACDLTSSELGAVSEADAIVLAPPVDVILRILPELRGLVRPDAIVTDVGSTKKAIVDAAARAGLDGFIGGHPMAGGERSGPAAARADLFSARPWFMVAPESAPAHARDRIDALVRALGANPVWTDAVTHDRAMAAVSHLPQVIASALMNVAGEALDNSQLSWAGNGLRDSTRLAASSSSVWQSILASNAEHLRPLLLELSNRLRDAADHLTDRDATIAWLDAAAEQRRRFFPPA